VSDSIIEYDNDGHVYKDGLQIEERKYGDGRMYVKVNGKIIKRAVVVCTIAHGPKPPDKDLCAHRNDLKDDDRPENVYWATYSENAQDALRNCRRDGMPRTIKMVKEWRREIDEEFAKSDANGWTYTEYCNWMRDRGDIA
jgi:hypothetical protein